MENEQQPPPEEKPKMKTIEDVKADVCKAIQNKFSSPMMRDRLMHLAKGDESLVVNNLNSFLTIIANDDGTGKWDNKKYLCQASTSSLSLCFLESMQIGIPIDRRGLVHIVVYGTRAELEIDYKGFIYYLSKHYDSADFDVRLVFEGDKFKWWSESGDDKYEYRAGEDRISNDYTKVMWAFCFITYVKNNREHSRIEVMDRTELDLVRSKAKTKNVWNEWTGEMYKKAVVRRACKLPLAAVDENAIESIDNKNFELDRPAAMDRLELLMKKQKEITDDEPGSENPKDAGSNVSPHEGERPDVDNGGDGKEGGAPDKGRGSPATIDAAPQESREAHDSGSHSPREISDADFEEVEAPPKTESKTDIHPDYIPAVEAPDTQNTPPEIPDATPANDPPAAEPDAWDGQTLIINGRHQKQDFPSAVSALAYLRKIMEQRKHKSSRKRMIEENSKLVAALIKTGNGNAVAEMHKLADKGADDGK